ncbi:formate dehydrogenase [Ramlibacter tataouinensis]|uniref:formate dehydrogenase n=1 Tax=Ramlibacter tataouinensis TaxID=94132 RepID=UPI0022F393F4|nr:formate dehydrogenase [Ramlibacter tataouinensis]WBY03357.1 formate dehydrogenase [Ramlibacter tataouinensis]
MSKTSSKLSRRTLFAGAATTGALAVAGSLLPGARRELEATAAQPKAPERGGGYQLTEHVKRYYETTRL